jgi:hypothetical protein
MSGGWIAGAMVVSAGATMYAAKEQSDAAEAAANRQAAETQKQIEASNARQAEVNRIEQETQSRLASERDMVRQEEARLREETTAEERRRYEAEQAMMSEETREAERIRQETTPIGESATLATTSKRKKAANPTDLLVKKAQTTIDSSSGIAASGLGLGFNI